MTSWLPVGPPLSRLLQKAEMYMRKTGVTLGMPLNFVRLITNK